MPVSLAELIAEVEKEHGKTGTFGGHKGQVARIPTTIFPLDLTIGGGIPRGRVTEIYGPEGSNKTNLCLKTIASAQQLEPNKMQVFFDMEGTWDPEWARLLGVDPKRVWVDAPDYVEELSDKIFKYVEAPDVNVIVLDSLAACITTKEGEQTAEKATMGNAAIGVKNMVNRLVVKLKQLRYNGDPPAMIWTNQTRNKLGVMFGDPETTPGGNAPRFLYTLRLRCWGKKIVEKDISEVLPAYHRTTVMVKKNKIPITALQCEFDFITQAHKGFKIGECDDWGLIQQLCKNNGLLEKDKKGWLLGGELYKTLDAGRERYYSDFAFKTNLQQTLFALAVEQSGFMPENIDEPAKEGADGESEE